MFKLYSVKQVPKENDVATVVTTSFTRMDGRPGGECFVLFPDEPGQPPVARKLTPDGEIDLQALACEEAGRIIRRHLEASVEVSQASPALEWEELDKRRLTRLWIGGAVHGLGDVGQRTGERELKAYLKHLTSVPGGCCGAAGCCGTRFR